MTARHAPFTTLESSWDRPEMIAIRRHLAALHPELHRLVGHPMVGRDEDSDRLLAALVDAGRDGQTVALVLLAPALDRVSAQLASTWRADADEVAGDVAAEAWARLQAPPTPGRMWVQVVGRARLSVRHRLSVAARHRRRRAPLAELAEVPAVGADPAEVAEGADDCRRRLARVAPADVRVIVATRHGGWTVTDWAAYRELDRARVYSARSRAEALIRRAG